MLDDILEIFEGDRDRKSHRRKRGIGGLVQRLTGAEDRNRYERYDDDHDRDDDRRYGDEDRRQSRDRRRREREFDFFDD